MAYDRPSWSEIDKMKDKPSRRKKREKERKDLPQHSTRYDKYKSDLNRLFDQGMAGELLKKAPKEPVEPEEPAPQSKAKAKGRAKTAVATRKGNGRIPKNSKASTTRLKLIRAVIDAEDGEALNLALDELSGKFGLPDDWQVLVRVLEYHDEALIIQAVGKMHNLLASTAKIPRRFTLKERLRSIGQTAVDQELRNKATELEELL
jgi:hypothetical protein